MARTSSFTRFLDHNNDATQAASVLRLHDYTQSHHSRYDSSGRVISLSQRPLPDNTQHSQQKSMPPVGFEPTTLAGERPQTYALDRAANGTGEQQFIASLNKTLKKTPSLTASPLRLLRDDYPRDCKPDFASRTSFFHVPGCSPQISQERPLRCCCYARLLKTAWLTASREGQETAQGLQLCYL